MDAKICDVCGAVYYPSNKDVIIINPKRPSWIENFIKHKQKENESPKKWINVYFESEETELYCNGGFYNNREKIDLCPSCEERIYDFIEGIYKEYHEDELGHD